MVIIGILLSFILLAAADAQARANERATQALIQKLETGLNDRLDALLQNQPEPNFAHAYLGAIWVNTFNGTTMVPPQSQVKSTLRSQVIALYDFIKSEMPDVFYVLPAQQNPIYPINFAGVPYTAGTAADPNGVWGRNWYYQFVLPIGHAVLNDPLNMSFGDGGLNGGVFVSSNPNLGLPGSGVLGASYAAAAGIYKNLGYMALGYDGTDNNHDGLIDDWAEGLIDPTTGAVDPLVAPPDNPTAPQSQWNNLSVFLKRRLANHTHKTARAEMLYAILVEGSGPWGSVFSRSDFSDKEVKDTDGDGLPEFVDAWGQPLQFFRWPVLYHSDFQKGQVVVPDPATTQTWDLAPPYLSAFDTRERNPLDTNQQLTAPGWWSASSNTNSPYPGGPASTGAPGASNSVATFETFFHRLTEPFPHQGGSAMLWDMGGSFRRAFFTKFLILSGGQDQTPGVFLYSSDAVIRGLGPNAAFALIANENSAMPFGLDLFSAGGLAGFASNAVVSRAAFPGVSSNDPANPSTYDIQQAGQDDITNHNLPSSGGTGGTGS
jgi:hypothetical protein